jgi:hypothetical protein
MGLGSFFSFLILHTVCRTPWTADQAVTTPLSTHRQTCMPRVGFERTVPEFERAKTVHALGRAVTVTDRNTKKKTPWSESASELTDRATAACRRSDCQLLRINGARGQRDGSLRPNSRFSRPEPLLFYQVAPQLYSRG